LFEDRIDSYDDEKTLLKMKDKWSMGGT